VIAKPNFIALIVATASFIQQIDSTIIVTSLPRMAISLHGNPIQLGGAITVYALSLAVFMPLSGRLSDRFGASRVFRLAIVIFTLGSVLCGLSGNVQELLAARFLQGFGGAMMTPVGRLLVLRASEGSQFVVAMAWLQAPAQLGPVIGLPLGGLITTYGSWRWNFFINVPVGVVGVVLATIFIENAPGDKHRPFDAVGFVLSGATVSLLVHGLNLVGLRGGDLTAAIVFLAASAALGLLCVLHARRQPHPMLDLSLLRVKTFASNFFAGSLFRYRVDAIPFLLPLLFQIGFGMTAFASGLLTVASALGSVTMRILARPILRRFGFRRVLVVNGLVSGATIFACALFTASTPALAIFAILTLGGFFRALQFVSLNTIAYADVDPDRMSAATSLASMGQQLSNAVGVAVAVIFLRADLAFRGVSVAHAEDFRFALIAMACVTLSSVPFFALLPRNAGSGFSGHRA
jgi:EmrB/QacA subfamily drug resistance transporter